MSRRGRRSKANTSGPSAIYSPLSLTGLRLLRTVQPATSYGEIEDRRQSHPLEYFRPNLTIWGGQSQGVTPKKTSKFKRPVGMPSGLQFVDGQKLVLCVKRKRRKEVLFAKKKTGKGSRARRRRRNHNSNIGC